MIQGFSDGISWEAFFLKIAEYTPRVQIFSTSVLKYVVVITPFFKFILGVMIALGVFTKPVLFITYFLFFLVAVFLFLFDVKGYALFHTIIATILYTMYTKIEYNRYAMDEKLSF